MLNVQRHTGASSDIEDLEERGQQEGKFVRTRSDLKNASLEKVEGRLGLHKKDQ
jgi:hypothetical protein